MGWRKGGDDEIGRRQPAGGIVLKVGQLSERTGLTVRTLHHWDEIGLLRPGQRTKSGHRLYGEAQVERLQRILSLRQLGLSLEEIERVLGDPAETLERVLGRQLEHLRGRIALEEELCGRLEAAQRYLRSNGKVSVEALLELMEATMDVESYYTPEQLEYLKKRGEALGVETIRSVEQEWPQLIAKVKAAMESGVDPSSEEVRALAKRWAELVEMFTGGDAGVTHSLSRFYQDRSKGEGGFMGIDGSLMQYVGAAMRSSGSGAAGS